MAKLTAVYQGNAVDERINDVVAEVTAAAIGARVAEDPAATVRVAEVGAGAAVGARSRPPRSPAVLRGRHRGGTGRGAARRRAARR
ncbi:hypothetical protein, partial [Streptomyces flavofungini]|uniref:hypothetical protein n=1 Tax=Streptomyces flavofungini TaxID=68200 RepID=UPI0034DF78B0